MSVAPTPALTSETSTPLEHLQGPVVTVETDQGDELDVESISHPLPQAPPPFSLEMLSLFLPFTMLGLLTRLGIRALTTYDGASVFNLALVQALGCLIMGVAVASKAKLHHFYSPSYTAIATGLFFINCCYAGGRFISGFIGYCGSLTTFSSWQIDVYEAWANTQGFRRGWLRSAIDGIERIVITVALAISSIGFGLYLARHLPRVLPSFRPLGRASRAILLILSVGSYVAAALLFVYLDHAWWSVTGALLFSYPGTLSRYVLAYHLNTRWKALPAGTLTANILGTAVLAGCILGRASGRIGPRGCGLLEGVMDGFSGCLSTVSTLAMEMVEMKGRKKWMYLGVSLALGQITSLLILGVGKWAGHLEDGEG